MTRKEWQQHYELSDGDMKIIEDLVRIFNGKVTKVVDKSRI